MLDPITTQEELVAALRAWLLELESDGRLDPGSGDAGSHTTGVVLAGGGECFVEVQDV